MVKLFTTAHFAEKPRRKSSGSGKRTRRLGVESRLCKDKRQGTESNRDACSMRASPNALSTGDNNQRDTSTAPNSMKMPAQHPPVHSSSEHDPQVVTVCRVFDFSVVVEDVSCHINTTPSVPRCCCGTPHCPACARRCWAACCWRRRRLRRASSDRCLLPGAVDGGGSGGGRTTVSPLTVGWAMPHRRAVQKP